MRDAYPALAMPEISGADALLGNKLYAKSGRVRVTVEGKTFRVAFLPAFPYPYRPSVMIQFAIEDRRAALDSESLPLPELLGYPEGGLQARDLPPEILRSYLEGVLGDFLDRTGRLLGKPIGLVDAGLAEPEAEDPIAARTLCLELTEEDASDGSRLGSEHLRVRLHLAEEDFAALVAALPEAGPAREEWADLPVAIRFRVGEAALTLADCGALGMGDIILLADDPLARGGMRLSAGDKDRPLWTATWNDGTISIEEGCNVDIEEKIGSQGAGPENLEALEVLLTFDLGGRMVTLAELRGLAAGSVFPLPENPDARVGIRAGGKAIGTGSLIMVDGRAGVRVDSLWNGTQS